MRLEFLRLFRNLVFVPSLGGKDMSHNTKYVLTLLCILLFVLITHAANAAFTEFYVTAGASGGGVGSEGDPFTLAEAFADTTSAATNGVRYNILKGAYSSGTDSISTAGSTQGARVYRGYNSSIGDLIGDRVNSNGEIDATDYPIITMTGVLTPNVFVTFEALKFIGSPSSSLVGDTTIDTWSAIHCVFINSGNNASSRAVFGDNKLALINCDLECSGPTHAIVVQSDANAEIKNCRIKSTANHCMTVQYGRVSGSVIFGDIASNGIIFETETATPSFVDSCTIYGVSTAIEFSATSAFSGPQYVINCHITDNAKPIACLGTLDQPIIQVNNRLRDNVSPSTGIGDSSISREITTDTGGPETDYENAGAGNFNLISGAPGRRAGLFPFNDVGALQHEDAGGGAGGGGMQIINGGGIR